MPGTDSYSPYDAVLGQFVPPDDGTVLPPQDFPAPLFVFHQTQLDFDVVKAETPNDEPTFANLHSPTQSFDAPQFGPLAALTLEQVQAQDPNVSNLNPYDIGQLYVSHEGNMELTIPIPWDRVVQPDPGVKDAGASAPALNDGQAFHLPYPPVALQSSPQQP